MKFSILTITKNAQKYLNQTLLSVQEQTFHDFEHILLDGGSSDQTLEIASRFPHLKVYEGKDKGISDAMNKAVLHSQGEYLIHLHADDFLNHPKVLSQVATTLLGHPSIEWLYGIADFIDEKGGLIRRGKVEQYNSRRLLKYNFITHPATVIKRALFDQLGGFNTSLRIAMDYDLWLRASFHKKAFVLPTTIATVRLHQGSLSTREKKEGAYEAYVVRNQYIKNPYLRWRSYRTWKKRKIEG